MHTQLYFSNDPLTSEDSISEKDFFSAQSWQVINSQNIDKHDNISQI